MHSLWPKCRAHDDQISRRNTYSNHSLQPSYTNGILIFPLFLAPIILIRQIAFLLESSSAFQSTRLRILLFDIVSSRSICGFQRDFVMVLDKGDLLLSDIQYYGDVESSTQSTDTPGPSTAAAAGSASTSASTVAPAGVSSHGDKEEPSAAVIDPVNATTMKEESKDQVKPALTSDVTDDDDEDFKPMADIKSESDVEEDKASDEEEDEQDNEDLPEKDRWELKYKKEKLVNCTHYREAHVQRRDGSREKFKLGDCVWMRANGGEIWVGLILDFYFDSQDSQHNVLLRWFYNENHLESEKNVKIDNIVQTPFLEHELFFSDDLDFSNNEVDVIEGKVHLFQKKSEYEQFKLELDDQGVHRGNTNNSRKYLVRNFYRPTMPKKLRALEPGELNYLLKHPEVKEMWGRFAKAGSARNTYAGKGTGGGRDFQPTSKIRKGTSKEVRKGQKKFKKLTDSMDVDEEEGPTRERTGKRQRTIKEVMYNL